MPNESPVNLSSDANLTPEMKTYYNRGLLHYAMLETVYHQFGEPAQIPHGWGKTIEWRRPHHFDAKNTAALTQLTEGTTPTGSGLQFDTVTATVTQYGDYYAGSDIINTQTFDPLLTIIVEEQAYQMALVLDDLTRTAVMGGTNVQYANGRTARANILITDTLNDTELRKALRTMKNNAVKPLKSGTFVAVIHPFTWFDMMADATFRQMIQYGNQDRYFNGQLGKFLDFTFVESQLAPVLSGAGGGAPAANVYQTLIAGKGFFGTVDISGLTVKSIYKPLGSGGTEDPLEQRWTQGWKAINAVQILNNNFGLRIEHGASS